jgi:hypothetical protein
MLVDLFQVLECDKYVAASQGTLRWRSVVRRRISAYILSCPTRKRKVFSGQIWTAMQISYQAGGRATRPRGFERGAPLGAPSQVVQICHPEEAFRDCVATVPPLCGSGLFPTLPGAQPPQLAQKRCELGTPVTRRANFIAAAARLG